MALRVQIAKFKFCQYLLKANSPNLMLANVSRYTVDVLKQGNVSRLILNLEYRNSRINVLASVATVWML